MDWGHADVKWAQLQSPAPGEHRLHFLEILPIAEAKDRKEQKKILREFVEKHHLRGTPVAVSFHENDLHTRRLTLPRLSKEDLQEAVRWQMREIAEKSIDSYSVRYSVLEERANADTAQLLLLAFILKNEVLENRISCLQETGLKPFFLEPSTVSFASTIERVAAKNEEEWICAIDLGRGHADFFIIHQGKLQFIRSLAEIVTDEAVSYTEDFATKLSLSIQSAMDAFSVPQKVEKMDRLFIGGGGAASQDLNHLLTKNLGVTTEIFNPFYGIIGAENFPLAVEKPYLFAPALGMAILEP